MSNRLFTTIPVRKFPSNTFSLSASRMFSCRLHKVYCPEVIETLPGDGFNIRSEQFSRSMPMVAPTFAKINADQFSFFVPAWQLNEHFDDFITGGEHGDFSDKMPHIRVNTVYDPLVKFLEMIKDNATSLSVTQHRLYIERIVSIIEHMDLMRSIPFRLPDFQVPLADSSRATIATANYNAFVAANSFLYGSVLRVNLMPFGAYLKVYSEYFRDENLTDDYFEKYWKGGISGAVSIYSSVGRLSFQDITGVDYLTISFSDLNQCLDVFYHLFGVLPRAWKKDYFTAALPFTQKGPDVLLPLSGTFPVQWSVGDDVLTGDSVVVAAPPYVPGLYSDSGTLGDTRRIDGKVNLSASGLGSTIQDVRRAFALEEFYEADGRGGNRYPENTMVQWGVRTPDSRLPRAQFLGSNNSPVQISEVVQTSETSQTSPQGNLAGKSVSYGSNRLAKFYSSMHGFLVCLFSMRVTAVYEGGMHPMFSRYDRTEYAWPRFAHLGEQPVYDKELYINGSTTEDGVFGYEPRYSEYKSDKSSVHGMLKGSLNFWTMSRRFSSQPQLSQEFIYNSPRLDSFQVTNEVTPPFITEVDYRVRANRKLPFFGVPSL